MDACYFCGNQPLSSEREQWTLGRQRLAIPRSAAAVACVNSTVGELWICEACYCRDAFRTLSGVDRAEIHYQMGIEYEARGRYRQSVSCLKKGLRIRKTADMLALLALNYQELGQSLKAIDYYTQALNDDPAHFMARENLKKLERESSMTDPTDTSE